MHDPRCTDSLAFALEQILAGPVRSPVAVA